MRTQLTTPAMITTTAPAPDAPRLKPVDSRVINSSPRATAIARAMGMLKALGCEYIVRDEGTVHIHGDMELATPAPPAPPAPPKPEPKRRNATHRPHGALKAYYLPFIAELNERFAATSGTSGELIIPWGPFNTEREALRSAVTAHCTTTWGVGSYISECQDDGLYVLRCM